MAIQNIWGTYCEIMAVAYLFGINILVAIDSNIKETSSVIWHKYATCTSRDSPITDFAIYIANQKNHFEPVTQLEFTQNPSFKIGSVGTCIVAE